MTIVTHPISSFPSIVFARLASRVAYSSSMRDLNSEEAQLYPHRKAASHVPLLPEIPQFIHSACGTSHPGEQHIHPSVPLAPECITEVPRLVPVKQISVRRLARRISG